MTTQLLPAGFRAGGLHCGLKKTGALDLGLLLADRTYPAAALFTRNELLGAHIEVCRDHLARTHGQVRAVLVNSGNANCATGRAGVADARELCAKTAAVVGCAAEEVLMISTGVIGARLPVERIAGALPALIEECSESGIDAFTRAIMTTDTHPKLTARSGLGDAERPWSLVGCAKGSGMIHPDMATMLAFLLTDVDPGIDARLLLHAASERSFHRVTVDGDTSPNDTVLLWSSAKTTVPLGDGGGFPATLIDACQELSRMIAADGEGATRQITIRVTGAASDAEAAQIGRLIATSPLVKTAVTGRDPNWGRILAAAGRAGVPFDLERVVVSIGDNALFEAGSPHPEREAAAHRHLTDNENVTLAIDLARGPYEAEVWTCDLTGDYVQINADYRS